MRDYNIRQLASAVMLQAVEDYMRTTTSNKQQILRDLRSKWMDTFTDGMSTVVAEQLELHPDEIRARLKGTWKNGVNSHW